MVGGISIEKINRILKVLNKVSDPDKKMRENNKSSLTGDKIIGQADEFKELKESEDSIQVDLISIKK